MGDGYRLGDTYPELDGRAAAAGITVLAYAEHLIRPDCGCAGGDRGGAGFLAASSLAGGRRPVN